MSSKPWVPLLLLVVGGGASATGQERPAVDSLRLGPGDAVRIEAFLATSLRDSGDASAGTPLPPLGDFGVGADGSALLPVLGLTAVAGRAFGQVRLAVEDAFAARFVDARVRVTPLIRVALLGEVRSPGLLPVDPTMALADVVAAAGGLTPSANRKDIRLVREGGTVIVAAEAELPSVTVPLRSGDRIVIGRRSWASENLPFLVGAGASVVAAVLTAVIVR